MSNLIDKQKAIDALDKNEPDWESERYCQWEEDKKAINNLPSAQPSHIWHSINEEPPSDDRKVLVSFANFSLPMIGRFEGNPDDGYTAYIGDMDETFIENDLFVDGWWELPKKPEGE